MSTTTVPIPPTSTSGKIALWGGVAALALIGIGLAWQGTAAVNDRGCSSDAFLPSGGAISEVTTLESGARFQTIRAGKGANPTDKDVAMVSVKVTAPDGTELVNQPQSAIPVVDPSVDSQFPGLSAALKKTQADGSYRVCIPARPVPKDAAPAAPGAPPQGTALRFQIDVLGFQDRAVLEQQMRAMQDAHGGGAGPGGPLGQ